MATVREYIAYARATCFPALLPEAANVSSGGGGRRCLCNVRPGVVWALCMHVLSVLCAALLAACLPACSFLTHACAVPAPLLQALSQNYVEMRSAGMSRKVGRPCSHSCLPACCSSTSLASGLSLDRHRDVMPTLPAVPFHCRRLCLRHRGSWSP